MGRLRVDEVAKLLGFTADSLRNMSWRGGFRISISDSVMFCNEEDVDSWLATLPTVGFSGPPPTVASLRRGEFLTIEATRALISTDARVAETARRRFVRQGRLGWVQLSRTKPLYHAAMLGQVLEETRQTLPLDLLPQILGASISAILRAVTRGDLVVVNQSDDKYLRVTRASVLGLLARQIPVVCQTRWVMTPEAWLAMREVATQPLMGVQEVAERIGCTDDDVRELLAAGEMVYIVSPGGKNFMVLPESVGAFQRTQPLLTREQQAAIFGCSLQVVIDWRALGLLVCPLHPHKQPGDMYRWCVVAYLRSRCSPATDPVRWVRTCLEGRYRSEVWPEVEVFHFLKKGRQQVRAAIKAGHIAAVATPAGSWVCCAADVRGMKRRKVL